MDNYKKKYHKLSNDWQCIWFEVHISTCIQNSKCRISMKLLFIYKLQFTSTSQPH